MGSISSISRALRRVLDISANLIWSSKLSINSFLNKDPLSSNSLSQSLSNLEDSWLEIFGRNNFLNHPSRAISRTSSFSSNDWYKEHFSSNLAFMLEAIPGYFFEPKTSTLTFSISCIRELSL